MKFFQKHYLIILIWLVGLFFRLYRQNYLLGFYYDQGRDAQIATDIIGFKNFPVIGPTTGINGLFLGPFWYYLITPGYFFANGNPAIASYFIIFIESLTVPLIYILVKKNYKASTATLAAIFWSFSHYLIRSSRWFSNPSPLPFFVSLILLLLTRIVKKYHPNYLLFIAILLGLTLQLEAASAIFFFPVIIIFMISNLQSTKRISLKEWLKAVFGFCLLLIPQIGFELKNNFLITKNFFSFLTGKTNTSTGKSWAIPNPDFIFKRLTTYYQTFFSKLDTNLTWISIVFLICFVTGIVLLVRKKTNSFIKLQLYWLFVPLFLLLFFVGNYGNLYDYYLTGFFPAFIILFSIALDHLPFKGITKNIAIIGIFTLFLAGNIPFLRNYIIAGVDGPEHITIGNQRQAVNFICQQTKSQSYNVDVYVPPVIPYAYDYLFSWYIKKGWCESQQTTQVPLLYTLYEVDPPHPERLQAWLDRQNSFSRVLKENRFGGVVVQQRQRK